METWSIKTWRDIKIIIHCNNYHTMKLMITQHCWQWVLNAELKNFVELNLASHQTLIHFIFTCFSTISSTLTEGEKISNQAPF